MSQSTFFLAPLNLKLQPRFAVTTCIASKSTRRQAPFQHVCMKTLGGDWGDSAIPFGRFSEFTSPSEGSPGVQDEIVREVLRQATHLSTSESMDSTIQTHLDAVSDLLSDMYTKTERNIEERNQKIAIQTSLPEISKWNKQLIDGNKASRQHRLQISKELALVDALLKRTARTQKKGRHPSTSRSKVLDRSIDNSSLGESIRERHNRRSAQPISLSTPNAVLFTVLICTVALESFDSVTSREGGAARLANYAAFSALLILSITYIRALRALLNRAQKNLDHHTGTIRGRYPSDRP